MPTHAPNEVEALDNMIVQAKAMGDKKLCKKLEKERKALGRKASRQPPKPKAESAIVAGADIKSEVAELVAEVKRFEQQFEEEHGRKPIPGSSDDDPIKAHRQRLRRAQPALPTHTY